MSIVKPKTKLKAIRLFCLNCCGDDVHMVKYCSDPNCPLWGYRFGMDPRTLLAGSMGEGFRILFEKDHFREGEICDSDLTWQQIERKNPLLAETGTRGHRNKNSSKKRASGPRRDRRGRILKTAPDVIL